MTLPFRRRHHDDESAHDRARALTSHEMVGPLGVDDTAWLTGHLGDCAECRSDREAYLADRELLRSLRDATPEPPRDLWARTSAALDREAPSRRRRGAAAPATRRGAAQRGWRGLPFGAAAGALIVLVVIGASIVPPITPSGPTPGGSAVAVTTPDSQPTPIALPGAGRVGWIQPTVNGSWELIITDVDAVCPRARPACRPETLGADDPGRPVDLGSVPTGVTISPSEDQLVVEARGNGGQPARIFVVPVPAAGPGSTPIATILPTETTATEPPTPPATIEPASPEPTPGSTPTNAVEIAFGVAIVGEAAYSDDGKWLAFSAKPSDGSTGPDLYLWSVGQDSAVAVTTDHQTYFSSWLDGQLLASRVDVAAAPAASPGTETPAPTADATEAPASQPAEGHPSSFLLDPSTLARTKIAQPDVWLPVVDHDGRFVAYWAGTLRATPDGHDWQLGTGQLVLDGWSAGLDVSTEATTDPAGPSGEPEGPAFGPIGQPTALVAGETAAFKAKFDPTGTRLAVWVGEQADATVGRLHLIVLDPETGAIDEDLTPLPGAPALRRFSIDKGRLAWVSPRGQDGKESAVQVLGWSHNDFGGIQTLAAKDLFIVR